MYFFAFFSADNQSISQFFSFFPKVYHWVHWALHSLALLIGLIISSPWRVRAPCADQGLLSKEPWRERERHSQSECHFNAFQDWHLSIGDTPSWPTRHTAPMLLFWSPDVRYWKLSLSLSPHTHGYLIKVRTFTQTLRQSNNKKKKWEQTNTNKAIKSVLLFKLLGTYVTSSWLTRRHLSF